MTHWFEGPPADHFRRNLPATAAEPIRAFVAIRLGETVEAAISDLIGEIKRPHDGIRWVPRENLHVTLKFLGPAVDTHRLEMLTTAMHSIVARTAPFPVEAAGTGAFPNLEQPRVVWVGLHGIELGAFAARIEKAASECGFPRETRRFSGHLTIGRVRDAHDFAATRKALIAANERSFGESRIESITLYRSHTGPSGSKYEPLATFLFRLHQPTG
ncbi:MAG TPA: RNA 2',3'-cyclic phosphodiesterase [Candidatus Binataceae bacterium]|nr:RNA 2',3'-cyclic phosphodiesterase [Candidatus Binataceae bacterium]